MLTRLTAPPRRRLPVRPGLSNETRRTIAWAVLLQLALLVLLYIGWGRW